MSEATKRKHVTRELESEYPEPGEDQTIVKASNITCCNLPCAFIAYLTMAGAQIIAPRGNNLHEATWPSGETFLVSMPPKFRKHVWIKRGMRLVCDVAAAFWADQLPLGMYVIAEDIEEGDKVKAEIMFVLQPMQIKHLQSEGLWHDCHGVRPGYAA
jgi:probable RNA-binding protein EIF1AD